MSLINVTEFHQLLDGRIGLHTIRRATRDSSNKGIRHIKIGTRGKILIFQSEVEDWPKRLSESEGK
jgi:hypothetical protein